MVLNVNICLNGLLWNEARLMRGFKASSFHSLVFLDDLELFIVFCVIKVYL